MGSRKYEDVVARRQVGGDGSLEDQYKLASLRVLPMHFKTSAHAILLGIRKVPSNRSTKKTTYTEPISVACQGKHVTDSGVWFLALPAQHTDSIFNTSRTPFQATPFTFSSNVQTN